MYIAVRIHVMVLEERNIFILNLYLYALRNKINDIKQITFMNNMKVFKINNAEPLKNVKTLKTLKQ